MSDEIIFPQREKLYGTGGSKVKCGKFRQQET